VRTFQKTPWELHGYENPIPSFGFAQEEWHTAVYLGRPHPDWVAAVRHNINVPVHMTFSLWVIPKKHEWDHYKDWSDHVRGGQAYCDNYCDSILMVLSTIVHEITIKTGAPPPCLQPSSLSSAG
jgi:hypothetical protein